MGRDLLLDPAKNPLFYEFTHGVFTPADGGTMLNWGYAPFDDDVFDQRPQQPLQAQLYKETFRQLDEPLHAAQTVCEMSCGQGSGLAFIKSITDAKVIGLERSMLARRRARRRYGLTVMKTVGPDINLPDSSVDIILSVEAAHNYYGQHFISEISRCLRPGGKLLITDVSIVDAHRAPPRERISSGLESGGLKIEKWRDVTANVIEALKSDNDRKIAIIDRIPKVFQKTAHHHFCTEGSALYQQFMAGERYYYMAMATLDR